ncbi:MAG: glycopeptide resistance accessory protein VanW [Clostridiaceae bacterium]|nr:glycopeptide resistance accessory protein VanW [Clostridiaceae bacterium]
MPRKRITQIFPWLLPLRTKQRLFCFYTAMHMDGNRYASIRTHSPLPHLLFETRCPLYNKETGFDMVYQDNKVFNLKLAAAALEKIVIRPGETFSFWKLVQHADRETPYKEGLIVVNGKLTTTPGGGMCQMSNLLFWMFLHAPLTVLERHGHEVRDFPDPPSDAPMGVDATVSEGWRDLKVKNETDKCFQISIAFDDEHIIGRLLTDSDTGKFYEVSNGKKMYYRQNGKVFEEVDVNQKTISRATGTCLCEKLLYRNKCEIGYPLPDETKIAEKG